MTYTLLADGTSDQVLIPIINWSLQRWNIAPINPQWVDLGRIPRQPSPERRYRAVFELYPCDVLFVHRDAEAQPAELRRVQIAENIAEVLGAAAGGAIQVLHIPVVPVRMTEAWLLADERAIRAASGNPNGNAELGLPDVRRLEELPDPKATLFEALRRASGLNAQRRSKFRARDRVRRIPDYIDDYSPLDVLPAFAALQTDIRGVQGQF